jgi:nicotinate-nucleotide adenylyltransferase
MKIALFGSAFNPPSVGHADCIDQLAQFVDEVWLVPSFCHAFNKSMTPYEQRCAWVEAFAKDVGTHVQLKAVEHEIAQGFAERRAVYSFEVVEYLIGLHPEHQFVLAIGPDNMLAWNRFSHTERIHERCQIMVTQERLKVRSTGIRQELCRGYVPAPMLTPLVAQALSTFNPWKPIYVS